MIHDDGTMDVLVDGRIERRPFEVRYIHFSDGSRRPAEYDPEVGEREIAMVAMGESVPSIIRTEP